MNKVMINLGMILVLFGILTRPAKASSEEWEKLTQKIDTKMKAYSNRQQFPKPPISTTLRVLTPDLVEKVETIYFTALDYQFLSLRSLKYAKYFLNEGNIPNANKYVEKADRYYKLAVSLQKDSLAVLQTTITVAQWKVVYQAARTALGFITTDLGIIESALFDIGALYADYLLDTSMMPIEEAKRNLIAKAISITLLRSIGTSEFVGDTVKHGWGSSGAFPVLQEIMSSSEFKNAVLKEFMRLGGDVGDYIARRTIEEALERIIHATGFPSFPNEPISESETSNDMSEPQLKEPSPEDEAELSVKPLDNSVIFDDNLSVAIAKIERESNTATVWLAFRRIAEQWHISKRGFKLRIIDDRQNKYEKYFHVWGRGIYTPRYGPLHLEGLPCGFTWVIPIEITRISSIAPVSKIEIERDFWNWLDKGDKPKKVCFELDFANPTFPNLEFKITPEQLLLPGDEVRLNKDISFRVGNLMLQDEFTDTPDVEKRFVFTLPLIVRNDDYNAHTMNRYALAAQFEDGRFITSDKKGWQGPKIQAQSTYTYNVKVYIGFKKDLEGIVSLPHRLILYTCNSPTAGYRFYRFVPISPELKRQCVEIKNTAVHNDSKQNQTQTHTKKEKQTKKIEKQVEEKVEKAVDSMFDRLFKKKR